MLEQYDGNTFSTKFSDADIHWHLWNEVIEQMKSVDVYNEMANFGIEHIKRNIFNSMVENIVIDECPGLIYLHSTLCVLCVLNSMCDTCPLERCYKEGHLYSDLDFYMSEARYKSLDVRDYIGAKRDIEYAIVIAKVIRDILCSTGK